MGEERVFIKTGVKDRTQIERPHAHVVKPLAWPKGAGNLVLGFPGVKKDRVSRPATATGHQLVIKRDFPGIRDGVLVTAPHPEGAPVAAGDAHGHSSHDPTLEWGFLTLKQSRHCDTSSVLSNRLPRSRDTRCRFRGCIGYSGRLITGKRSVPGLLILNESIAFWLLRTCLISPEVSHFLGGGCVTSFLGALLS